MSLNMSRDLWELYRGTLVFGRKPEIIEVDESGCYDISTHYFLEDGYGGWDIENPYHICLVPNEWE